MFWAESRELAHASTTESSSPGASSTHCSACMPPSEPPITQREPLDAEVPAERPVHGHEIGHRERGKAQRVGEARRRVERARARRAVAAAEQVRRDHEARVRVDRPARADHVGPPAGPSGRGVRVAGQGMADVDRVVARPVQRAVRLVGDLDRRERLAGGEHQRVALVEERDPPGLAERGRARAGGCRHRHRPIRRRRACGSSRAPGRCRPGCRRCARSRRRAGRCPA